MKTTLNKIDPLYCIVHVVLHNTCCYDVYESMDVVFLIFKSISNSNRKLKVRLRYQVKIRWP